MNFVLDNLFTMLLVMCGCASSAALCSVRDYTPLAISMNLEVTWSDGSLEWVGVPQQIPREPFQPKPAQSPGMSVIG